MIRLARQEDCCGCAACAAACPHRAIRMEADGMGFRYPVVDEDACVDCGICEEVCAFHKFPGGERPRAEAIRFPYLLDKSQSGGLSFALMRKSLLHDAVVYGAAMEADFTVRHRRVTRPEDLSPLRLSKYVQSDMNGVPAQVLKDLREGRQVLFTGTPCQCAGIASLCGRYRDRLILADIVCHGVPAPAIWRDYLAFRERQAGEKITGALFRDPSLGWHIHKEALTFASGRKEVFEDYTFLFYRHLMLRPSCTACPFASVSRPSDLTMADCWGVEEDLPGFADDNRGCSLLLVHSERGSAFTSSFPDGCERRDIPLSTRKQPNLEHPSEPHPRAKSFENDYLRRGFGYVLRHYGPDSPAYRLEQFIKKVKRHL